MESKRAVQRRSGCAVRVQACSAGGMRDLGGGDQRTPFRTVTLQQPLGRPLNGPCGKGERADRFAGMNRPERRLMFVVYPLIPLSKLGTTRLVELYNNFETGFGRMEALRRRVSFTPTSRKGSKTLREQDSDNSEAVPNPPNHTRYRRALTADALFSPTKPSTNQPDRARTAQEPAQAFQRVESTAPAAIWNTAARRVRRQRTSGLGEMFQNQIVQSVRFHQWPAPPRYCRRVAS